MAKTISRRAALKQLGISAVGITAPSVALAETARPAAAAVPGAPPIPVPPVPAPHPAAPAPVPSPAAAEFAAMPVPRNSAGGHAGSLAAITNVISGSGLYIGNGFLKWTDQERQIAFAAAARWGFTFVCPKVGGYGKTWYADLKQLQAWKAAAQLEGIKLAPFIYTIPGTSLADAAIAAAIANTCDIVVIDMEDEWGSDARTGANQGGPMAGFGDRYRRDAPSLPVIVTSYGDPVTRFGKGGYPFLEMQAWADAYSPQFYYGVWSQFYNNGPEAAIEWGARECAAALHPSFPIVPSVSIYSAWSKSGIMSPFDLRSGRKRLESWPGPLFWWEYTDMADSIATVVI